MTSALAITETRPNPSRYWLASLVARRCDPDCRFGVRRLLGTEQPSADPYDCDHAHGMGDTVRNAHGVATLAHVQLTLSCLLAESTGTKGEARGFEGTSTRGIPVTY